MKHLVLATLLIVSIAGCTDARKPSVSTTDELPAGSVADRDNTAINERDRDAAAQTPLDQNENQTDIDITAKIRQRVVATELSVNAQNVKVITQDGRVTLRGPVKSNDEKKIVEEIALAVAGAGNVDNQLEVERRP